MPCSGCSDFTTVRRFCSSETTHYVRAGTPSISVRCFLQMDSAPASPIVPEQMNCRMFKASEMARHESKHESAALLPNLALLCDDGTSSSGPPSCRSRSFSTEVIARVRKERLTRVLGKCVSNLAISRSATARSATENNHPVSLTPIRFPPQWLNKSH